MTTLPPRETPASQVLDQFAHHLETIARSMAAQGDRDDPEAGARRLRQATYLVEWVRAEAAHARTSEAITQQMLGGLAQLVPVSYPPPVQSAVRYARSVMEARDGA